MYISTVYLRVEAPLGAPLAHLGLISIGSRVSWYQANSCITPNDNNGPSVELMQSALLETSHIGLDATHLSALG